MSSVVHDREPLTDYPRSAQVPLNLVQPSAGNAGQLRLRRERWSAYLTLCSHPEAPLTTRYAPLLAELVLADGGGRLPAVPGSLYPVGFRRQVLDHTARPADAAWSDLRAPEEAAGSPLPRLRAVLAAPEQASPQRLVCLAQLLNVLTLYPVTVRALAPAAGRIGDPELLYEVARAAYSLQVDSELAVRPFQLLARHPDAASPVRLSAITRLVAHYCRRDKDLDRCAEWADLARGAVAELGQHDDFAVRLAISRLHRGLALYAWRRRDAAEMTAMMGATHGIAVRLVASADDPARYLAAAQDERLGLEAALKAFVGSRGRATVLDPAAAAERIVALDPGDPYSRLIAGDAFWLLGQDERALECFQAAAAMGTLPGTLAAHRAGVVLRALGRPEQGADWSARAAELDAQAGTDAG